MGSHLSEFVSVPALAASFPSQLLGPVARFEEAYLTLREALSHADMVSYPFLSFTHYPFQETRLTLLEQMR